MFFKQNVLSLAVKKEFNSTYPMMKKLILSTLVLFSLLAPVRAQDLIITKDFKEIKGKIIEVTSNEIKYKKSNNLDGPTYITNKSEILVVRYQNGESEVFNDIPNSLETEQIQQQPVPMGGNLTLQMAAGD